MSKYFTSQFFSIHTHFTLLLPQLIFDIKYIISFPYHLPDRFSRLEVTLNAIEFNIPLIPLHSTHTTNWFFLHHWQIDHDSTLEHLQLWNLQIFNVYLPCGHTKLAINNIYKDLYSQRAYILAADWMEFTTHNLFYFIYSISNHLFDKSICIRNSSRYWWRTVMNIKPHHCLFKVIPNSSYEIQDWINILWGRGFTSYYWFMFIFNHLTL